jgi:dihydroneopterin aldolase
MEMKIRNLRFPAVIGVHEWEKKYTRQFVLQLELEYDASMAAATDEITYAVNYTAVEARLMQLAASHPWQLIETLAESAATMVLEDFPTVSMVALTIEKPQALHHSESVSVTTRKYRVNH